MSHYGPITMDMQISSAQCMYKVEPLDVERGGSGGCDESPQSGDWFLIFIFILNVTLFSVLCII